MSAGKSLALYFLATYRLHHSNCVAANKPANSAIKKVKVKAQISS